MLVSSGFNANLAPPPPELMAGQREGPRAAQSAGHTPPPAQYRCFQDSPEFIVLPAMFGCNGQGPGRRTNPKPQPLLEPLKTPLDPSTPQTPSAPQPTPPPLDPSTPPSPAAPQPTPQPNPTQPKPTTNPRRRAKKHDTRLYLIGSLTIVSAGERPAREAALPAEQFCAHRANASFKKSQL